MRETPHVHERHLLEAVRQKVISHEQYDGILAIVRTMAHAEGTAAPDLGWISLLQAGAAGAAVGVPGIYLLDRLRYLAPVDLIGWSLLGALFSFSVGALLRSQRSALIAANVLFAAGVAFTWGLFVGAHAATFHTTLGDHYDFVLTVAESKRRVDALLVGDLGLLAVAALVFARWKTPVVAAPATMAFVHFVVEGAHRFVTPYDVSFGERDAVPWIALAGVIALVVGRAIDRKDRRREDYAFWMHLVGLLSLGFAFTSRIFRVEDEALVWSIAALVVIGLGVWWNRRVYLACGATAFLFWPALGLRQGNAPALMIGAFVFSSIALAVFTTWLRGRWATLAAKDRERTALRSVWG
jgi:hypothetical protein